MSFDDRNQQNSFGFHSPFLLRAGIVVLSFLLAALLVSRLTFPFDAGNAEALSWIPAAHLLAGENPYSFAFAPPYSMTPYGVVYYALLAAGIKLFGLQLLWGRILSVAGFAIFLFSAAKITRRLTGNAEAVLLTVLAGLAMFPLEMWVGLMRADLIAAAFAASAILIAFTFDADKPLRAATLAALLAALAFFTKHTFSLPACFIFLRFVQTGARRAAFLFAALFAVLIAASIWLLDYTSSGGYVWQHFVHARHLPFSFDDFWAHLPATPKTPALLFFLIFLAIFLVGKERDFFGGEKNWGARVVSVLRSPRVLIFIYFAASLASALASSARVGANVNYYIENSFALVVICGLIYDYFAREGRKKLSAALVACLALGGVVQIARIIHGEMLRRQALPFYSEIYERAGEIISREKSASGGESFCVAVFPELVAPHGCALEFDDLSEYDVGWSPELKEIFDRRVASGRYAAIVWYSNDLQKRFPNYRLVETREDLPRRSFPVFLYEREK